MITRMTKYSFVLLSEQTPDFLNRLQDLGMVDINRHEKAVDQHSKDLSDRLSHINQVVMKLGMVAKEKTDKRTEPYHEDGAALLKEATELFSRKESLKTTIFSLADQLKAAEPWGPFTLQDVAKIRNLGYIIHAYVQPARSFDPEWEKQYPLYVMERTDKQINFIVLEVPGEPYEFPGNEAVFPPVPCNMLKEELGEKEAEMQQCIARLEILSDHIPLLKSYANVLSSELDLYLAGVSAEKQVEDHIDLLTGFAPTDSAQELEAFLEKESLYYLSSPAESSDNPPVKLKNSWFPSLFEPIGNMYMLPVYDELDLTPYFPPFYMLFFGFCLGDMGYGLLLILAGLLGRFFLPKMKAYLNLVFFLGLGSVVMAALPGSFFGMKVTDLFPSVTKNQDFLFQFNDMQMFWFAILFGLFQIVFARVLTGIDSIKRKGWQHGMAPFGWAILIVWATIAYASTMVENLNLPKPVSTTMLVVSISLIVLFSKPEGPVYKRLGKGLWAMYDITGVFGDMLSYIRLFGLGTSGGILGMVINTLAMSLSGIPYVGWLLTLVLLLFGHALVLGLSALGAFVHPMRLTFVEFYKNASFTGGGREYKPLKIKE
ncbi:MAG TPA: hypothetical protein PKY83_06995 [Bacteroidales bacterium]|jgi:V/A-type H+-transporting ATPase subunit I|nr:hypothetical protein [Bacteroidales bacterium]MCZ2417915.1 hypothetical protein [Burkholderiales bacterium]OQC58114.1 MAG: V-type ATP synthase subunit I [Bacteroidetes bacterium ADurb.Bin013]MBP8999536.1 hypothetical protein [Bacteroidales bacterium]MBV6456340.1 hypothetical protein [Bacteroidales bacterium]